MKTSGAFLRNVCKKVNGKYMVIWTKQDKISKFFNIDDIDQINEYVQEQAKTKDVYFGIGLQDSIPEKGRGKVNDIKAIPGFWMDIDIAGEAHKHEGYPTSIEEAKSILDKFPLKPTAIVNSGFGLHVYWLFQDVALLTSEEQRAKMIDYSQRFQKTMIHIAAKEGYKLDNTSDLTRVLRVPGTLNHKQEEPVEVTVIEDYLVDENYRYSLEDFQPHLVADTEVAEKKVKITSKVTNKVRYDTQPTARMEAILGPIGCKWMQHCQQDAEELLEPEWYQMLTVTACCEKGEDWAHVLSEPYPDYDEHETSEKFEHSKTSPGPVTCSYVKDHFGGFCEGCNHKVKSPAVIGNQKHALRVALMDDRLELMIEQVEAGDKTAHFAEEHVEAMAVLKQTSLQRFHQIRLQLKNSKCSMDGYNRAIDNEIKKQLSELEQEKQERNFNLRPVDEVYDSWVEDLEETRCQLNEEGYICAVNEDGDLIPLANFVAKPIREVTLDNGVSTEKQFEITGILSGGEVLPTIKVPATEFHKMDWALEHWGIQATILSGYGAKDRVREAVQLMGRKAVQETIYTHLGWKKVKESWVYLHGNGCIGDESVSVEVEDFAKSYSFPAQTEDIKTAMETSIRLMELAPRRVTMLLWGYVYLSILCEAARQNGIEPRFILWVHGLTGTRKTSLSMIFLSHFGSFSAPPASFKDTTNALERKGFMVKDNVLLVDDYHPEPTQQEAKQMEGKAQHLLRQYGDRIGKGRMQADTSFRQAYPPRGLGLITGEDIPSGESSNARLIAAELFKDEVDLELLTELQNQNELLTHAMRGYIEWLAPQMDEVIATLKDTFIETRSEFQQAGQHGRLAEAAAWLKIGFTKGLTFAEAVGAVTTEDKEAMVEEIHTHLIESLNSQHSYVKDQKPEMLFIHVLEELINSEQVYMKPLNSRNSTPSTLSGKQIGYFDSSYYYLYPEETVNLVNDFLRKQGKSLTMSPRIIWQRLDESNLIKTEMECQKDGKKKVQRTIKKKIPNRVGRPRLLHLKVKALDIDLVSDKDSAKTQKGSLAQLFDSDLDTGS